MEGKDEVRQRRITEGENLGFYRLMMLEISRRSKATHLREWFEIVGLRLEISAGMLTLLTIRE